MVRSSLKLRGKNDITNRLALFPVLSYKLFSAPTKAPSRLAPHKNFQQDAWLIAGNEGILTVLWLGAERGFARLAEGSRLQNTLRDLATEIFQSPAYASFLETESPPPRGLSFKRLSLRKDGASQKLSVPFFP